MRMTRNFELQLGIVVACVSNKILNIGDGKYSTSSKCFTMLSVEKLAHRRRSYVRG